MTKGTFSGRFWLLFALGFPQTITICIYFPFFPQIQTPTRTREERLCPSSPAPGSALSLPARVLATQFLPFEPQDLAANPPVSFPLHNWANAALPIRSSVQALTSVYKPSVNNKEYSRKNLDFFSPPFCQETHFLGDTCGKRRQLKRRQLASTGSTRMTIHGQSLEYLPKCQADLEEKQESCNPPKGSDQPPPTTPHHNSAAAKTLILKRSFSATTFCSFILPLGFFCLTLFKSCSLITRQLKAIKEFSEQQ